MAKLRKSKELQVHIVEQHNDVVPPIHRGVASRLLPFSGAAMVHLDSHPDLLLPVHMPADIVFKPAELYDSLSIENWILPLVFAKHLDHIVWVKPPWAHQIPVSKQSFLVGQCSQSATLRVTSKENYFLTDGLFRPAHDLVDPCELTLQVEEVLPKSWSELDSSYTKETIKSEPDSPSTQQSYIQRILKNIGDKVYILDIDLDFFSTANPFRDFLEPEEEQALRRLYHYETPTDFSDKSILSFTSCREDQLNLLEDIFTSLEEERTKMADLMGQVGTEMCVNELGPLTSVLKDAEEQGLEEEKIQDLTLLCRAVLKRSTHSHPNTQASSTPLISPKSSSAAKQERVVHASSRAESPPLSNRAPYIDQATESNACSTITTSNQSVIGNPLSSLDQRCSPNPQSNRTASFDQSNPSNSSVQINELASSNQPPPPNQHPSNQATRLKPLQTLTPTSPVDCLTFLQLHDFGCTLDDTELPHHLSSPQQVKALQEEVKVVLESLPRPALVTIARSSDDGYCPKPQVDEYERDTLKMLEQVFGALHVTKHYES